MAAVLNQVMNKLGLQLLLILNWSTASPEPCSRRHQHSLEHFSPKLHQIPSPQASVPAQVAPNLELLFVARVHYFFLVLLLWMYQTKFSLLKVQVNSRLCA